MKFSFFSQNGAILPIEKAVVPIENIEYMYGFGVYESMKVRHSLLYFVDQHIERLLQSAKLIELEHNFNALQIKTYIQELVQQLQIEACNIKMLLIGADNPADVQLYIIPLAPLYPDRKLYKQGAKLITVNYARWYPKAKSLNMLPSYLAYRKAKKQDCYDGLLIDNEQNILEGTRTNFFAIKGKHIVMPPLEKVLEGVTLMTVLYVAKKQGYTIQEEDIPLTSLPEYGGAFLTSTSSKIIPISQINDICFATIASEIKELMKSYNSFLDECNGVFTP
jgi:branched-chain amino acid aminotransferase